MGIKNLSFHSRALLQAILSGFDAMTDLHYFILGEPEFREEAVYCTMALIWFRGGKEKILLGLAENGVSDEEIKRLYSNFEMEKIFVDEDQDLKEECILPAAIRILNLFSKIKECYDVVCNNPEYQNKWKAARLNVEDRVKKSYSPEVPTCEWLGYHAGLRHLVELKTNNPLDQVEIDPKTTDELIAVCMAILTLARSESIVAIAKIIDKIKIPQLREMLKLAVDGWSSEAVAVICSQHRYAASELFYRGKLPQQRWQEVVTIAIFVPMLISGAAPIIFEDTVREILNPSWLKAS